jgi:hypothetical protein
VSAPPKTVPRGAADGARRKRGGVHSQALFRAVNEEICRLGDGFAVLKQLEFVCECEREDCFARFPLSLDDYEAIRRFPARFLVQAEHVGADDRIVGERDDYVVVEKVGAGAETAILLDPRRRATGAQSERAH